MNTQHSYRDTFLSSAAVRFFVNAAPVDRLTVDDLSPDLIRMFLAHVEDARHCSIGTRNQRLATIHSLARFIGERSPEHVSCAVRSAPSHSSAH